MFGIRKLKKEIEELRSDLDFAKKVNAMLKQDVKDKTKTIKNLEDLVKSLKEDLKSTRDESYEITLKWNELKEKLDKLENQADKKIEEKKARKTKDKKEVE